MPIGKPNKSRRQTKTYTQSMARADFVIRAPEPKHSDPRFPLLRAREKEIVERLRRGYSNQEIANELLLSVKTVKWYVSIILEKFDVRSSKQLIVLLSALPWNESRQWHRTIE